MERLYDDRGQATLELLVAVPVVIALGWCVWQVSVAGQTAAYAASAARAAARAASTGTDLRAAAMAAVPRSVADGIAISRSRGGIRVTLKVPLAGLPGDIGMVDSRAGFPAQR